MKLNYYDHTLCILHTHHTVGTSQVWEQRYADYLKTACVTIDPKSGENTAIDYYTGCHLKKERTSKARKRIWI